MIQRKNHLSEQTNISIQRSIDQVQCAASNSMRIISSLYVTFVQTFGHFVAVIIFPAPTSAHKNLISMAHELLTPVSEVPFIAAARFRPLGPAIGGQVNWTTLDNVPPINSGRILAVVSSSRRARLPYSHLVIVAVDRVSVINGLLVTVRCVDLQQCFKCATGFATLETVNSRATAIAAILMTPTRTGTDRHLVCVALHLNRK